MHLYFLIRGIKQQVDLFEMFMQTQMFRWDRVDLTTKEIITCNVQGSLRITPFGYEYVFPKEHLNEVLTMLDIRNAWSLGKAQTFFIRKMLGNGFKKIPKYEDVATNRYIEKRGIAIYPIGIKEDVMGLDPANSNIFQEML